MSYYSKDDPLYDLTHRGFILICSACKKPGIHIIDGVLTVKIEAVRLFEKEGWILREVGALQKVYCPECK